MSSSTSVSVCFPGRVRHAAMLQPMAGGEHADARAVEVSGRLKAAGGATYGHGTCRCRGRRTALKGLYPRRSAGGGCGTQPRSVASTVLPTRRNIASLMRLGRGKRSFSFVPGRSSRTHHHPLRTANHQAWQMWLGRMSYLCRARRACFRSRA